MTSHQQSNETVLCSSSRVRVIVEKSMHYFAEVGLLFADTGECASTVLLLSSKTSHMRESGLSNADVSNGRQQLSESSL